MRWACGAWVVDQIVSLPGHLVHVGDLRRTSPCGAGWTRGYSMSWVTTTSALAKTASVAALSPDSQSKMWLSVLPSMSSRITGASGVERPPGVDDRRQRLVLDLDELEGVAGRVPVLGHDEGHLLALEAHLVGGKHGERRRGTGPGSRPARASRVSPR